MNQTAFIGRIVRPIEVKNVGENRLVVNNTIAIQRYRKNESGQEADFIPFVAWGKTAELIDAHCHKGDLIGLTGRMQSRSYLRNEQDQVFVVELVADEVQFLQPKKEVLTNQ